MQNKPEEWFEKYLYSPGDIYTGKCVPVANDTLAKLIAETERRTWEEADKIVRETMDSMELRTNAEFIACDDLAIKLVKAINSRIQQYGKEE